jgi:S-formylglutathione hydrolase FrmB
MAPASLRSWSIRARRTSSWTGCGPDLLEQACAEAGQPLRLRRQPGYDHSFFFVASFIEDHLRWHAERLGA